MSLLYYHCLSFVNVNPNGMKEYFSKIAFASLLHQGRCRYTTSLTSTTAPTSCYQWGLHTQLHAY